MRVSKRKKKKNKVREGEERKGKKISHISRFSFVSFSPLLFMFLPFGVGCSFLPVSAGHVTVGAVKVE